MQNKISHKNYIYIYTHEICIKNRIFVCKVGYKNENERSNKELKIKNKEKMIIIKIYLGISLELFRAVWGQFSFR